VRIDELNEIVFHLLKQDVIGCASRDNAFGLSSCEIHVDIAGEIRWDHKSGGATPVGALQVAVHRAVLASRMVKLFIDVDLLAKNLSDLPQDG
jgi:hypothetical protein